MIIPIILVLTFLVTSSCSNLEFKATNTQEEMKERREVK